MQHGILLCWASEKLRDNGDNVLTACMKDGAALLYASRELRSDRSIVILCNDYEVLRAAVCQTGKALQWSDKRFHSDPILLRQALETEPVFVMNWLSNSRLWRLCDDEVWVQAAVTANPLALKFASERCKDLKRIVQHAVSGNGAALQYPTKRLQLKNCLKVMAEAEKRTKQHHIPTVWPIDGDAK